MSVSKMKLVNISGDMSKLSETVSALGETGVFQPDETADFYSDNAEIIPVGGSNEYQEPLDRLKAIMTQTGIRPELVNPDSDASFDENDISAFLEQTQEDIGEYIERRDQCSNEIELCERNIETIGHFLGLDINVEELEQCEFVITNFGRLSKESYSKLQSYDENPYVEFFPCTKDKDYYWGVYVTPVTEREKVDRIFSRLYFEKCDIKGVTGTPKEYLDEQKEKLDVLKKERDELNAKISEYTNAHKDQILKAFTQICRQHAYVSIRNHACSYHKSFVLVGWIPSEYEGTIEQKLSAIDTVEVTFTKAIEELKHSPPVKLKNRFFAKPFEYYTKMYGMPGYNEIDPSAFIALTYTLLFGVMFADVGQGIVLLLASIYMYKIKKMPLGRLLIPCSVFSVIFGFIFGSVFGFEHLLDPVYKALFGLNEKPVEVMESNTTMILIFGAVGIGVILLIIAMALNIISSFKRGDIGNALFGVNGAAGLLFYSSLVIGLALKMLLSIDIMSTAYIWLLIVLPILIVFFREPLSRLIKGEKKLFDDGIGSFIVDNFFELFEVCLSYVTNTMSFLRVGAFVLVHAGMMQVVFVLGQMCGEGTAAYYAIIVFGNILVLVLEALLVGIQVLRLEYYEMFNRFFIGDGREYEPVTLKDNV